MGRKSLLDRYEELEANGDDLARRRVAREAMAPSPVHVETVRVLGEMLEMGRLFSTSKVPAPLRAMMRTLHHLEPTLVEELANVDPAQIQAFLGDLAAKMQRIADTPINPLVIEGSATRVDDVADRPAITAGP